MSKQIVVRALKITQTSKIPLYSFYLRGEEILEVAEISRIKRNEKGSLLGYQRGEVSRHIGEITDYLDSGDVIFPNAILLAMSTEVKFKQSRGPKVGTHDTQSGVLNIPIGKDGAKAAWIVDGQQRTIALSNAKRKNLLVPVTAFVSDDFEIHRSQFLLVNKVKPLPKGLINELLPVINTTLPASLAKNKIPSAICELLNRDPDSPFQGLIIRQTTDRKEDKHAVIADNSLLQVVKNSLNSPHGCLYQYRNVATGEIDAESVRKTVNLFWSEVKNTFPEAWGIPPTKSRLMAGVGIKSMGVLMDRIMGNLHPDDASTRKQVQAYLKRLKPFCAWTSGTWEILDGIPWNTPQNTSQDIRRLSNALVRAYLQIETA
jgi:DGQHR domain-containing protein